MTIAEYSIWFVVFLGKSSINSIWPFWFLFSFSSSPHMGNEIEQTSKMSETVVTMRCFTSIYVIANLSKILFYVTSLEMPSYLFDIVVLFVSFVFFLSVCIYCFWFDILLSPSFFAPAPIHLFGWWICFEFSLDAQNKLKQTKWNRCCDWFPIAKWVLVCVCLFSSLRFLSLWKQDKYAIFPDVLPVHAVTFGIETNFIYSFNAQKYTRTKTRKLQNNCTVRGEIFALRI